MIDIKRLFVYFQNKFIRNQILRYKLRCLVRYFLNRTSHIKAQYKMQNSSTNYENF